MRNYVLLLIYILLICACSNDNIEPDNLVTVEGYMLDSHSNASRIGKRIDLMYNLGRNNPHNIEADIYLVSASLHDFTDEDGKYSIQFVREPDSSYVILPGAVHLSEERDSLYTGFSIRSGFDVPQTGNYFEKNFYTSPLAILDVHLNNISNQDSLFLNNYFETATFVDSETVYSPNFLPFGDTTITVYTVAPGYAPISIIKCESDSTRFLFSDDYYYTCKDGAVIYQDSVYLEPFERKEITVEF